MSKQVLKDLLKAEETGLLNRIGVMPREMLLLYDLAIHSSQDDDTCYPSLSKLASRTKMSKAGVRRAIHGLQEMNMIEVIHRKSDVGDLTSNSYRLNFKGCHKKPPKEESNEQESDDGGCAHSEHTGGVQNEHTSQKGVVKESRRYAQCEHTGCGHYEHTRCAHSEHVITGTADKGFVDKTSKTVNTTSPSNPIKPRLHAHAKGGALMGYVVEGSVEGASPEKETDGSECDLPMTAMMDAKRPPQGYPDEDKFYAFAKTLVLNHDYENTILQAAKYVFEQMCKQGFADAAGNYFKNWRKYARSSIAKLVDDAHRHIINWDDSLVNIRDVTPAEIGQWRPQSAVEPPSEPATPPEPQKPMPPPTEERKPDPKPEQPSVEIPAVEPPPPKRSTEEIIRADPTTFRTASVARLRLEREEAARRARAIAVSSGHAEGVYYRGNG